MFNVFIQRKKSHRDEGSRKDNCNDSGIASNSRPICEYCLYISNLDVIITHDQLPPRFTLHNPQSTQQRPQSRKITMFFTNLLKIFHEFLSQNPCDSFFFVIEKIP